MEKLKNVLFTTIFPLQMLMNVMLVHVSTGSAGMQTVPMSAPVTVATVAWTVVRILILLIVNVSTVIYKLQSVVWH